MRKKSKHHLSYPGKSIVIATMSIWIVMILITVLVNRSVEQASRQKQVIALSDHMIIFQNELQDLLETGINLISGYEAYIKVHGTLTSEQSEIFLQQLMKRQAEFVRNIGIIKDTTIVYNYPMEENDASIGKDLVENEQQKAIVLKVKKELLPAFQGPVDLVQGGVGYILRVPLLDQEEEYWGQASIVLRAERIHIRILELARENDMEVLIQDANQKKIIGNEAVLLKEPRSFSNNLFNDWEIYAIPEGGWTSNSSTKILILLSGLIVATLLSAVIYFVLHSTYRLKYNMSHDQLTDLYNRHYLDGIQKKIVADSNENKSSFGLMHIDLDDFKSVNDLHGHEKGDYVLSEMAKILKTISRSEDLIFRIGGDEFLIIAVQIRSREELEKMRLRYYEEMESMSHFDKYLSMTRPSIGIALYNKDGYNFDQVMKVADLNMYEEKARNKKEKAER